MRGLSPMTFTLVVKDESTIMHLRRITPHKRVEAVRNAAKSTGYPALRPQYLGCLCFNNMKGTLEVPVRVTNEVSANIVEAYNREFLANLRSTLIQSPPKPQVDTVWR